MTVSQNGHLDAPGAGVKRDAAEPAHADFGEQQAGLDPARDLGAGVDQQFAEAPRETATR